MCIELLCAYMQNGTGEVASHRCGGFPSVWTVGKYLLGAFSHFVLGRCVPLPLSTTISHVASPTWPQGLIRHECLDCWSWRYKAPGCTMAHETRRGNLRLCGENQQYGCCRYGVIHRWAQQALAGGGWTQQALAEWWWAQQALAE